MLSWGFVPYSGRQPIVQTDQDSDSANRIISPSTWKEIFVSLTHNITSVIYTFSLALAPGNTRHSDNISLNLISLQITQVIFICDISSYKLHFHDLFENHLPISSAHLQHCICTCFISRP